MPTSVALPTSHHFHPSLSPVVSLSLGIMHEWTRTQMMLANPSSNLLQRTGGDHRGGCTQLEWRTFMTTCLCWILRYMRLEIWCKIDLSGDWCLCTALRTHSDACMLLLDSCIRTYVHLCPTGGSLCFPSTSSLVWYGMVNVDLYSAIITKVSNALNTLVSGE